MSVKASLALLLLLFAGFYSSIVPAGAQLVATRDLTSGSRAPSEQIASPSPQACPKVNSTISEPADDKNTPAAPLEVTIVAVTPLTFRIGNSFTATVRLKNTGSASVMIPSIADGQQLSKTSSDGIEEKYEAGDISFRLATGKNRNVPTFLNSSGALFANPGDAGTYISIAPGNWLDIKMKAIVECGVENCEGGIQPDTHASLSAWWYQRILTHRVNGCDESHGTLKVRQVDSPPVQVAVRSSTPAASH